MKRKRIVILLGSIALVLVLVALPFMSACAEPTLTQAPEPIILRFALGQPPVDPTVLMSNKWSERVLEASNGQIMIEVYPGGKLYGSRESPDAVVTGACEITQSSIDALAAYCPLWGFSIYPYLVLTFDQFTENMDGIFQIDAPLFEKCLNSKLLFYAYYVEVGVGSKKPVEKVEDLKGQRLRVPGGPPADVLKAWGASPMSISASECYSALEKGSVDGACSSYSAFASNEWYKLVEYYTGPLWWSYRPLYMNLDAWNALSEEQQTVMLKVNEEISGDFIQGAADRDTEALELMKKELEKIKFLTPEEREAWASFTKPAYDQFVKDVTDAGYGDEIKRVEEWVFASRK